MQNKAIQGFQLSPQQKQLWLLRQSGQASFLQTWCAVLLKGNLIVGVLKEAVRRIVNQHEILRTTFRRSPGMKMPLQVIAEVCAVDWEEINLADLEPQQQRACIEEYFREETDHSIDLEMGSPLRLTMLNLSTDKHLLIVSLPSLCADARTLKNLVDEIGRSYAALLDNEELGGEPLQYADYAEWQNELLAGDDAEAGRDFWKEKKYTSLPNVILPFEGRYRQVSASGPQSLAIGFTPDVTAKIESFAAENDATTPEYLLACWQMLLRRLTGQADIVVGNVSDCRGHEELQEAMGVFAKCLPIRTRFKVGNRFDEILRQVHIRISEAYEWQEYAHGGDCAGVGFEFQVRGRRFTAGGVEFTIYRQHCRLYPFKLALFCLLADDGLVAEFHYDGALFRREDIERLAGQFEVLVTNATENAGATVDELKILSESERSRLLIEFNRTAVNHDKDTCIHRLFEEQVKRTPDAIAVVFEGQQLSYAQLNAQANKLAHLLRQRRVTPDVRVGLCMERSAQIIVGLLGILKAGGAYVPLNPEHPKARLAHQLAETEAPAVIIEEGLIDRLPDFVGEIIVLCQDERLCEGQPDTNPEITTDPQHLAYIIYTSGSTGTPKGVAVTHECLVNYTRFICERLQATSLNRGLHFATVSTIAADLGNTCIFPSLISGGCLNILSHETATESERFARYISEHSVDVLKTTPSHFGALLAAQDQANILPDRYLILGGEALSMSLAERISKTAGNCQLINHYGPTETTVGALTFSPGYNDGSDYWPPVSGLSTVPVGRPIANTEVYILDENLEPSPVGVPGEVYIGGAGLARGYLNQPGQTAERFIPHPFSIHPGARLYKTGDLARYLPDGNVEFIGRNDHQVKVRGYRVELGEIEAVLARHPGVRQSVVATREDNPGDVRLIAYLAPALHSAPAIDEVRNFLREELPDYMVPSSFVILKSLPLTANGKVDRRALPAPDESRPGEEKGFVAPRTPVEERVGSIWAAVLGVSKVGVHDNFFDIGGHSLLVTQVISRLRKAFNIELPLRSLFESPTVAQLANSIEARQHEETSRMLSELEGLSDEEAERLFELEVSGEPEGAGPLRQVYESVEDQEAV